MSDATGPQTPGASAPGAPGTGTAGPPAGPPPGATTPGPAPQQDWTDQVTDLIVDAVDKVRSRTTGPILEFAKGMVYAVVAFIILVPVVIVSMAGLLRFLNWLLPGDVWIAYAVMAAIFVLVGLLLWSKRAPKVARR